MDEQSGQGFRGLWPLLGAALLLAGCGGSSSGGSGSGGGSAQMPATEAQVFCDASYAPVVNDFDPANLPPLGIDAEKKATLQAIRNPVFGGSMINAALQQTTISGEEPPVFALELRDRALLAWRINDNDLDDFSSEIGLPEPLALAQTSLPGTPVDDGTSAEQHYYLLADISNAKR